MAETPDNNPIDSGLKMAGNAAKSAGEGIKTIVSGGLGDLIPCLALAGCGGLIVIVLILLAFSMSNAHTRGLTGDAPPRVGANGGTTGGTGQGQLDPNSTDPNCAELKKMFSGTNVSHLETINDAASHWGVSAALVAAVAEQESGFNANATSKAGAQGLMQIMPGTWAGLYNPNDGYPNNPYDPRASAFYGAKYLSQLKTKFGDNIELIAAAYNAGPGAVENSGNHIPPYTETLAYVANVSRFYNKYLDCLTAESRPHTSSEGSIPTNATADERKVIETARNYHAGDCSGVNCYQHTIAVYNNAGMRPEPVGSEQWGGRITTSPESGYIMDLDIDHNPKTGTDGADHTVLFDHEETITYNGKRIRVWYYWNGDATNSWVYSSDTYDPATAYGSSSRTLPWSPDIDGLPVHMWRPVPK